MGLKSEIEIPYQVLLVIPTFGVLCYTNGTINWLNSNQLYHRLIEPPVLLIFSHFSSVDDKGLEPPYSSGVTRTSVTPYIFQPNP
jgi:hypothetical protein